MILPETFSKNEALRIDLAKAMPIIDLAFHALENEESMRIQTDYSNAQDNAFRYAELSGISRLKRNLRALAKLPVEAPSPLLDTHLGMDEYDLIAKRAEDAAVLAESRKPKTKKK